MKPTAKWHYMTERSDTFYIAHLLDIPKSKNYDFKLGHRYFKNSFGVLLKIYKRNKREGIDS